MDVKVVIYREKFGLSPSEFDKIPSEVFLRDMMILDLLAEKDKNDIDKGKK